jgi:hypothetical protein
MEKSYASLISQVLGQKITEDAILLDEEAHGTAFPVATIVVLLLTPGLCYCNSQK